MPATFLSMLEGSPARVGEAVNWLSLGVLTAESVVLLALASDRPGWLRTHRLPLLVALATIPAVVLALGPVQVVRLVRFAGVIVAAATYIAARRRPRFRRRMAPQPLPPSGAAAADGQMATTTGGKAWD